MVIMVFVTIPKEKAGELAQKLLEAKLCACVNIIGKVESYFWWEGKIDQASESLLLIKTKDSLYTDLERVIKSNHPYDLPEIIALAASNINKEYSNWLLGEVKSG